MQCLCAVDPATCPTLNVGMDADTRDGIYIRALQRLLVDMGLQPGPITGEYNPQDGARWSDAPAAQRDRSHALRPVEQPDLAAVRDRGCLQYDF